MLYLLNGLCVLDSYGFRTSKLHIEKFYYKIQTILWPVACTLRVAAVFK